MESALEKHPIFYMLASCNTGYCIAQGAAPRSVTTEGLDLDVSPVETSQYLAVPPVV